MADLNRNRGQLILVTAFALAAIFLGLAIIVNSAIFTENLATRSENVDSTEALEYRHSVEQFTGNVIEYANEHNYSSLSDNVSDGVRDLNDYSARQRVRDGAAISLELNSTETVFGSRIYQSSNTNFTSNISSADWTLAEDVGQARALEINATSFSGDEFRIVANDTDNPSVEEWAVTINSSKVTVNRTGVGVRSCPASNNVTVDVTGATVNGEPCPALQDTETGEELFFAAGITDEYEIRFENSDDITGNYSLVVDKQSLNTTVYATPGEPGNGPRQTDAMYSTVVDLEYETPEIEYEAGVRVAPGEPA